MGLFNQARDKIEDKVESAQNASMKVLDLEDMGNALVKNLQSKLERILGKFGQKRIDTIILQRNPINTDPYGPKKNWPY